MMPDKPSDRRHAEDFLTRVAGPLGPFVSIEDYLTVIDGWIDAGGPGLIDVLIAISSDPMWYERYKSFSPEELRCALSEVLSRASARYPQVVPPRLGPLLDDPATRLLAIDTFAAVGEPEGLPWLSRLLPTATELYDEEALHLAEAIADIGGSGGRQLLEQLSEVLHASPLRGRIRDLLDETDWSD